MRPRGRPGWRGVAGEGLIWAQKWARARSGICLNGGLQHSRALLNDSARRRDDGGTMRDILWEGVCGCAAAESRAARHAGERRGLGAFVSAPGCYARAGRWLVRVTRARVGGRGEHAEARLGSGMVAGTR